MATWAGGSSEVLSARERTSATAAVELVPNVRSVPIGSRAVASIVKSGPVGSRVTVAGVGGVAERRGLGGVGAD